RPPARRTVPSVVLSDQVPPVRARETAASAAAGTHHAADRCPRLLGSAARTGARSVSHDRPVVARRVRSQAVVLRAALSNSVLSSGNVPRREQWHPRIALLRQGGAARDHV